MMNSIILKFLGNGEFNRLKIILTLPSCVIMGGVAETGFKLRTTCSDSTVNYHLSQKLMLLGMSEFNYLTICKH